MPTEFVLLCSDICFELLMISNAPVIIGAANVAHEKKMYNVSVKSLAARCDHVKLKLYCNVRGTVYEIFTPELKLQASTVRFWAMWRRREKQRLKVGDVLNRDFLK